MTDDTNNGNLIAAEGQVFVCLACGKRSKDLYGFQRISRGWDESCMLNSALCDESKLTLNEYGNVIKVDEGGIIEDKKDGRSS